MAQDPTKQAAPNEEMMTLEEFEEQARQRHGIPKKLWKAIPAQESGGDWSAQSPTNVRGKYQMTQATAKSLGYNRDDPYEQAAAAAKYLRENYDKLEGVYEDENDRWYGAAAMYYGGPAAIRPDGSLSNKSLDNLSTPKRYVEQLSEKIRRMSEEEEYAVKSRANDARNLGLDLEKAKIEAQQAYAQGNTKGGDEALRRANQAATALQRDYRDLAEAGTTPATPQDPRQWPYVKLASGEKLIKETPQAPAATAPQLPPGATRTWGEAAKDVGLAITAGAVEIPGLIAGLVSPELGEKLSQPAEALRAQQSEILKQKRQAAGEIIQKAQATDGFWSAVGTAIKEYGSDPALMADFVASNVASSLPGVGAGKAVQAMARGRMLARGIAAVEATTKAEKAGAFTAQLANSIMNAGGARADAYRTLRQDYINQGIDPQVASSRAAWASLGPAAIGGVAGFVSGGTGLESRLFGKTTRAGKLAQKLSTALGATGDDLAGNAPSWTRAAGRGIAGFAKEEAGELLEEVPPQIATNVISPTRGALEEVPQTIGQTLFGAGPTSILSGALAARSPQQPAQGGPAAPDAAPSSPIPADWNSVFAGRGLGDQEARYAQALDDLDATILSDDPNVGGPEAFDKAAAVLQGLRDELTGAASPTSPRLAQLQAMLGQLQDPNQIASLQEIIDEETARIRESLPAALQPEEFAIEREDFAKQYGLDPSKPLAPQVAAKLSATEGAGGGATTPETPQNTSSTPAPALPAPAPPSTTTTAPTIDVSRLTQDEYAEYLIQNGLPSGVSAYDALTARAERRGESASSRASIMTKEALRRAREFGSRLEGVWSAIRQNPNLVPNVQAIGAASKWNNFEVNTDTKQQGQPRHKSYITLNPDALLDITAEKVQNFLKALQQAGFNGQVKFPATGSRVLVSFDNIVMHGATEADALLGQQVGLQFFGNDVVGTQTGQDVGGKSHTEQLAERVEQALKNKTTTTATTATATTTPTPPAPAEAAALAGTVDPDTPLSADEYAELVKQTRMSGKVSPADLQKRFGRFSSHIQNALARMENEGVITRSKNNRGWIVNPTEAATQESARLAGTSKPGEIFPPSRKSKFPPLSGSRILNVGDEVWIGDPREPVKLGTPQNVGRIIRVVPPPPKQQLFARSYVVELESGQQVVVPSARLTPNQPESRYADYAPGMMPTSEPAPPPPPPPRPPRPAATEPTPSVTSAPASTSSTPTTPPTTPPSSPTAASKPAAETPPPASSAPVPGGRRVEFDGQTYTLTPEQAAEWDKADANYESAMRNAALYSGDTLTRGKNEKAAGMRRAAARRKILNKPTPKEKAREEKREQGYFIGKEVSVDGVNGKVKGTAFGKVIILFDDGTRRTIDPERIKPPVEAPSGAPEVPTTSETAPSTEPSTATGAETTEAGAETKLSAEEFSALVKERWAARQASRQAASTPSGPAASSEPTSTGGRRTELTVSEATQQAQADVQEAITELAKSLRDAFKAAAPKSGSLSMVAGGIPVNLNPAVYRSLKPQFAKTFEAFKKAGKSIGAIIDAVLDQLESQAGFTATEIEQTFPYLDAYYREAELGETLEFPAEESAASSPTDEKDYSNWRELRSTQQTAEEVRARQEFNKERRRVEHDSDEKGARGYLSYLSYQTERRDPDDPTDNRPPALGEHPQLREALDLGPMPLYRFDEKGPVNPEWKRGIQDSTNAIADELFGDKRLSQAEPYTFEQAWNKLVELIEEIGQEVDPTLKLAWNRTTEGYITHAKNKVAFFTDPRYKEIVKDLYESAEAQTLTSRQLTSSKAAYLELALEKGLTQNWATENFKELKARVERVNKGIESADGETDRTGVEGDSEQGRGGDGRGADVTPPSAPPKAPQGAPPSPPPPKPPPPRLGQIQKASPEDEAMWKEISKAGRKEGGSTAIKEKYGEKGAWAMLVSQKIDDIMAEADERQTIIKECA